jgi:hypothetical protein
MTADHDAPAAGEGEQTLEKGGYMVWFTEALEVTRDGNPTGRWRMTATSDEGGGGPYGDTSHDHATPEEAELCERCDEYVSGITGFPSRKRLAEAREVDPRDTMIRDLGDALAAARAVLRMTPEERDDTRFTECQDQLSRVDVACASYYGWKDKAGVLTLEERATGNLGTSP